MSIGGESYVSRPKLTPQGASRLERLETDLEQARRLALLLEEESKDSVPEGTLRGSERIDQLGREAAKLVNSETLDEKKRLVRPSSIRLFVAFEP